ncbi:WD-40 repeat-containing protein [Lentinus tigrinus ALCF2SS1-7]|uniref:WD-40 repeat-containing protein n=1 Tax=Lentinus tigrinus ALCF2SS1-7 TaxID=1328758 RepID=UPI001165CF59|nr:WD-40 repeat-containing protein [Lentinus tigrinus ALCF2SS1-7]
MPGYDTDWPADSTEFCPHPSAQDIFVCGTYKLEQSQEGAVPEIPAQNDEDGEPKTPARKPQKRRGKCLLFRVQDEENFTLLQETELPAILDMKWCHRDASASPLLGIADSEGHITLHELDSETSALRQIQSISCATSDILCLSLDWSNRRFPTSSLGDMIVSLSNGSLSLLRPDESSGLAETDTWHAHDYEPWIAAWDYWNPNVVFSGGDDLKMKGWDIREGGAQPLFVNKRFDAGVTTIQSHPHIEHIIAVGSYDNTVRLFDTRKPLAPLTEVDVGGGAWRVKWHPSPKRKNDLLVACMHDGFKVVRFDFESGHVAEGLSASSNPWEVVKRFDQHTSLAYGADWSFVANGDGDHTLVASCSFYDHTLHLWSA